MRRASPGRRLRALAGTLAVALALPGMLLFGLVLIPLADWFGGKRRVGYEIGRWIMGTTFRLAGVRLEVAGREHIQPYETRVYMPNHTSLLDMPAVLYELPGVNSTLIKREAFRVPLVGTAFRRVGFLPVDRAQRASALRSLDEAIKLVRAGHSFVIAPEGTRSRTGRVGPFRSGGFRIALAAGAPIVPVSVTGAASVVAPGSWLLFPGVIRLRFHPPVPTAGTDRNQLASLKAKIRQTIVNALEGTGESADA